jgi:hypothetical protein
MRTTRRIVLNISAELYGRLEICAAEGRLAAREWALHALLAALSRPESKAARERRRREAGFALLSLLAGSTNSPHSGQASLPQAGQLPGGRGTHAAHT